MSQKNLKSHNSNIENLQKAEFKTAIKNDSLASLIAIGFREIGAWELDDNKIRLNLTEMRKASPALYAFIVSNEIRYIGKTRQLLEKRLYFYSKPGATQSTNIRVNKLIMNELVLGNNVNIFGFARPFSMKIGNFKLSLAGGLEDDIVKQLRPAWNKL